MFSFYSLSVRNKITISLKIKSVCAFLHLYRETFLVDYYKSIKGIHIILSLFITNNEKFNLTFNFILLRRSVTLRIKRSGLAVCLFCT